MGEDLLERLQAINPETIEQVTPDELASVLSTIEEEMAAHGETVVDPRRRIRERRWRGPAIAVTALIIGLLTAVPLLLTVRRDENPSATTTSVSPETTVPRVPQPEELVPTGVRLLTVSTDYQHVVRDSPGGVIWAGGGHQVARFDPATGEARVWTQTDDATFGRGVDGLAPARGGGVWVLLGDGALRWFDGERFRDGVEAPPMAPDRDEITAVVATADGSLLVATVEGGVFRWTGSSWGRIDESRPVVGAGSLAVDTAGIHWVGNVEWDLVQTGEESGGEPEWRHRGRGVSRSSGGGWETFTGDDAAALAGRVLTIEPFADGTVWVGTEVGLAYFDGFSWSDVDLSATGLRGDVYASVGPDGTIWVATNSGAGGGEGVASFDGSMWSVYGPRDGLRDAGAGSPPLVTDNGVFVGTHGGLLRLSGDRWIQVLPLQQTALPPDPQTAPVLAGVSGMKAFSDSLLVWGQDEIWRYADGAWSAHSSLTSPDRWDTGDVVYVGDTRWEINESGVVSHDGEDWVELTAAPRNVWRIAAHGILWLSTGEDLHRWDGEEMTNVGHPQDGDDDGYVGDIVVTADGSVWAAGLFAWVPWWGSLARYDDVAGSWEMVRPLGGDEDVPAEAMVTTPNGGLWVVLADWYEDWETREGAGEPRAVRTLAYRDGTSGEWTVHDTALTERWPWVMTADDDAVWLAGGQPSSGGSGGIARFDGTTLTNYDVATSTEDTVEDIAVAPDGTVWYVLDGVLYQLEI